MRHFLLVLVLSLCIQAAPAPILEFSHISASPAGNLTLVIRHSHSFSLWMSTDGEEWEFMFPILAPDEWGDYRAAITFADLLNWREQVFFKVTPHTEIE